MDQESHQSQDQTPAPTFPDLVKMVFTDYVGFARRYLSDPNPPLMYLAVWLIGMDAMAGSIELVNIAVEQYDVDNWFYAWLRIIVGGAPLGVFRYWIVGTLFHIVVLAAGGTGLWRTSRYILLYALLPMSVCNLSIKILQMLIYGNDYFARQTNDLLETIFGSIMVGVYVYTIVLCYRGMRELQQADKKRSIAALVTLSIAMIALTIIGMGG